VVTLSNALGYFELYVISVYIRSNQLNKRMNQVILYWVLPGCPCSSPGVE